MVVPSYSGEKYYKREAVVSDENLIITLGVALLEFTI